MKAAINSDKHYIQTVATAVASGAVLTINLVKSDNDLAAVEEVRVGSTVKAIYLEYWVVGAAAKFTGNTAVIKRPGDLGNPTASEMANLQAYKNKNNVLVHHQGLMPADGNTIPMFREWISIPRGKQRMAQGDIISVSFAAVGTTVTVCGFATYKEYF